MNNAKPTPGPWAQSHRKGSDGMYNTEVYDAKGETIATLAWHPVREGSVTSTDREANARLMAAAPELLEACNSICEAMAFAPKEHLAAALDRSYNLCRAAVEKAEGPPTPDRGAEPNTPEAK